jgi:hypothetical protein
MKITAYLSTAATYINLLILYWLTVQFNIQPSPTTSIVLYGATYFLSLIGHIEWCRRQKGSLSEWKGRVIGRYREQMLALAMIAATYTSLTFLPIHLLSFILLAHIYLTARLCISIASEN